MNLVDRRSLLCAAALGAAAAPLQARSRQSGPTQRDAADAKALALLGVPKKTTTNFAVNIEMWGFGTGDHAERIRKAADLGFGAVEFWPWRGKDLEAVAKACRDTNTIVTQFTGWGFAPGLNDPANHDALVKEIGEACDAAERVGAKLLTVLAGNDIAGRTREEMHGALIDGLKRAAPVAEKRGVTLILEPLNVRVDHRGYCLSRSEDAIRICKAVGSPSVKINWDLYHQQITEGDLCGHLREGIAEIGYVQVADHPGRNEPGTGEIHYNRVFRELHVLGYRGWVGLECSPLEGEAKAAERVRQSDVWRA